MGISVEQWRSSIGCFIQPLKKKSSSRRHYPVSSLYVSLAIRITLFLLLTAHGVESNPGPNTRNNKNNKDNPDTLDMTKEATPSHVEQPSRGNGNQSEIRNWLRSTRNDPIHASQESVDSAGARNDNLTEEDLKSILADIRLIVKDTNNQFHSMNESINDLKMQNKELVQQNEQLTIKVNNMEKSLNENAMKIEQLEGQSRRDNLKFYNVNESYRESWDESEQKIRNYIKNELEIDESKIEIERAHRLPGRNKPRAIIAKFSRFKDKEMILHKYKEKVRSNRDERDENENGNALGPTPVKISEDFPSRVSRLRYKLVPFMREALQNKSKC